MDMATRVKSVRPRAERTQIVPPVRFMPARKQEPSRLRLIGAVLLGAVLYAALAHVFAFLK